MPKPPTQSFTPPTDSHLGSPSNNDAAIPNTSSTLGDGKRNLEHATPNSLRREVATDGTPSPIKKLRTHSIVESNSRPCGITLESLPTQSLNIPNATVASAAQGSPHLNQGAHTVVGLDSFATVQHGKLSTHALMGCTAVLAYCPADNQPTLLLGHFGNLRHYVDDGHAEAITCTTAIDAMIDRGDTVHVWLYSEQVQTQTELFKDKPVRLEAFEYHVPHDDFMSYSLEANVATINTNGPRWYRDESFF